jgi:hypothetical protein
MELEFNEVASLRDGEIEAVMMLRTQYIDR